MPRFVQHLLPEKWSPGRAAVAGLIATAAYSIAMRADKHLIAEHFDDVKCVQGLLGDANLAHKRTAALAWGLHFLNGVSLAEVYALLGQRLLPGPGWFKGALFGEAFVLAVWPLTPLVDRLHPSIRNGQIPPLATKTVFWQNLLRHLVFGITLGACYHEKSVLHRPVSRGANETIMACPE